MTDAHRLPAGGRIDRIRRLPFTFDGVALEGCAGDTLASALLASGVHLVGRSFKYHRPRGILAAGAEEPNALVEIARQDGRRTPNLRATQLELYGGLAARSQNRWPSLRVDAGALTQAIARFLPPGFYYKTMMGPRALGGSARFWKPVFERGVRRMAGLGRAPAGADPDRYAARYAHCDVLVIGAGPAGLAAARAAAARRARVIVCDEQAELGGSLLAEPRATIEGAPAWRWLAATIAALAADERVTLLPRTQAFGYYAQNFVALAERVTDHLAAPPQDAPRERLWQVRAKRVVIAAGAIERPLLFPGNDRPGIMLADAARTYVTRYAVKPGSRAVVAAADASGYRAALALRDAGVEVAAIADSRERAEGAHEDAARAAGMRIETRSAIASTRGRLRVHGVTLGRLGGGDVAAGEDLGADLVLMAGGWTPSVHLFSQSRGRLRFDDGLGAFVPGESVQAERSAGGCRGVFDLEAALADGDAAGDAAAGGGKPAPASPVRRSGPMPAITATGGFVDFQNDVAAKDVEIAIREGFRAIEHVKRYTTTGLATDQGKTSNLNALALAAAALGKPLPELGLTTFRPPWTPVTFGTLAGRARGDLFEPVRRTPIDSWARERGAVYEDVGAWQRARFFPRQGEDMEAAVARECRTVRDTVGLFDASTLGKIEVVGPDAAEFLERLYVNAFARLEPGRCRYGILLNEAGYVIDDGVIARVASDRFHVTTTTGGAARVLHLMEDYRQTEFPELRVWLTSTTEQWAVIAVQGPRARDVLAPLVEGADIARASMPHMTLREGRVAGVAARIFRVSFSGELGFEVNVPAGHGREIWEAVWARAEAAGGCAYGTEAMHVLRAEKGYIIVGQETDGTMTPADVGLGWAIGKAKRDFIGKRSLQREDLLRADRKQLVGLLTADAALVLEEGAQVVAAPDPAPGTPALGHVTSAYASPALGRSIALAVVAAGRARRGEMLHVAGPGGGAVTVVDPVFLDKAGTRLDG